MNSLLFANLLNQFWIIIIKQKHVQISISGCVYEHDYFLQFDNEYDKLPSFRSKSFCSIQDEEEDEEKEDDEKHFANGETRYFMHERLI